MEAAQLLVVVALLGIMLGVGFAMVRSRTRVRDASIEPAPESPRVPPGVREAAEARAKAIREAPIPDDVPTVEDVIAAARLEAEAETDPSGAGADEPLPGAVDEAPVLAGADEPISEPEEPVAAPVAERPRFRDRLAKARSKLSDVFGSLRGATIDDDTWDDLEYALISADVGVEPTQDLLDAVKARVAAEGITEGDGVLDALKDEMKQRLAGHDLSLVDADTAPTVWLFVGVNGVGKTTTIGKLGKREADAGRKVVMAAGDTFRAAAAEQLTLWAERCGADIVRGNEGSDPSAVIFDAVEAASARGADVVLADTAGRLHTKSNLMEELRKVRRVAGKGAGTVTESLLVLDATTGQNGLVQAQQFGEAVDLTGVVLTKLDGSAKGGIVFAIQSQLGIPVKLVGLGEAAEDLVPFDVDEFVEALFA